MNDKFVFMANDDTFGREMWVTDGTGRKASLLKDIVPGADSSEPVLMTTAGNWAYFSARVAGDARLWKTDGTPEGTTEVKDVTQGDIADAMGFNFYAIGSDLYFMADDGIHGKELWISDGTSDGTRLVKDINPGAMNSIPSHFVELNGELYFSAFDGLEDSLWRSNGTDVGTFQIATDVPFRPQFSTGQELYSVGTTKEHGIELYVSDGTTAGTRLLKDINPGSGVAFSSLGDSETFIQLGSDVLFTAWDGVHGSELWGTDGTEVGTRMIKDLIPGDDHLTISDFILFNGVVYFTAAQTGYWRDDLAALWQTDSSANGTVPTSNISSLPLDQYVDFVESTASHLIVGTHTLTEEELIDHRFLWAIDNNGSATQLAVIDSGYLLNAGVVDSLFYFTLLQNNITALWATDGTTEGTRPVVGVGNSGDIDGDNDFDANDSFLIHLTMLSGTDAQINQSKGESQKSATEIRNSLTGLINEHDVDGDGDFDANDSFLVHLVMLSGSNGQIDQSKGASSLSAVQIRDKIDRLGGSGSSSCAFSRLSNVLVTAVQPANNGTVANTLNRQQMIYFTIKPQHSLPMLNSKAETAPLEVFNTDQFRQWIDVIR